MLFEATIVLVHRFLSLGLEFHEKRLRKDEMKATSVQYTYPPWGERNEDVEMETGGSTKLHPDRLRTNQQFYPVNIHPFAARMIFVIKLLTLLLLLYFSTTI